MSSQGTSTGSLSASASASSSATPKSRTYTTATSKTDRARAKSRLQNLGATCTCATLIAIFLGLALMARKYYATLKQPRLPDAIDFNVTVSYKPREIELQDLQKAVDKSIEATNKIMKSVSQGRYHLREKDEKGYAMFGFYDFHLEGVDEVAREGEMSMEGEAENLTASGNLTLTNLGYRGMAKWSWAFPAEEMNCTTARYSFNISVSLPQPETNQMYLLGAGFPPMSRYRCNRFHRYAKHSRREAKNYMAYFFRYAIQEFVKESLKASMESNLKAE